jgi:predicted DNA-binding WGR domain protein
MLANRKTVKAIVETLADMRGNGWERRSWCDKVSDTSPERRLVFKFGDESEADEVAKRLQFELKRKGYTNKVTRTSVNSDYMTRTTGGEYVRVKALFE